MRQVPDPPEPSPAPRGLNWSLGLGAALGLFTTVVLVFMSLGYFGLVLIVAWCVFAVGYLHYLVWGRWLMKTLRREAEEQSRDEEA